MNRKLKPTESRDSVRMDERRAPICGDVPPRYNKMKSEACDKLKQLSFMGAALTASIIVLWFSSHALAQYDNYQQHGGNGYDSGGGGGGYDDSGMDERPKLNLGIRLRIPAFRFELPRFSLPKITVSAKIRQPDKPRVINLPEINLDTTSKVEPPGSKFAHQAGGNSYGGGGGDYKTSSSSYQQPYGHQEKSQTFTFSTGEDAHPSYGNSYGSSNRYQQKPQYGNMKPMQSPMQYANSLQAGGQYGMRMQQHQQSQGGYHSASMTRPFYSAYNRSPGGNYQSHSVQTAASTTSNQESQPSKNPDIGFNSPVNA